MRPGHRRHNVALLVLLCVTVMQLTALAAHRECEVLAYMSILNAHFTLALAEKLPKAVGSPA